MSLKIKFFFIEPIKVTIKTTNVDCAYILDKTKIGSEFKLWHQLFYFLRIHSVFDKIKRNFQL